MKILLAALLLPALVAASAYAQTAYPNRPIRVIVPFPAGGPSDVAMRTIAPRLAEALGQQIIIDNRGGAGGATGTELVAKSSPDGYTLLAGTIGGLAVSPTLNPKLGYNTLRDLAPITQTVNVAYIVTLHPSVPAKSIKELLALARSRPGKLNYGTSGAGTGPHLAGELLNMMAGHARVAHARPRRALEQHGCGARARHAGTIRRFHSRRNRQVGQSGQSR